MYDNKSEISDDNKLLTINLGCSLYKYFNTGLTSVGQWLEDYVLEHFLKSFPLSTNKEKSWALA